MEPEVSFIFTVYNFSHRIDHLSFGEEIPGIINPLDGTEKVTDSSKFLLLAPADARLGVSNLSLIVFLRQPDVPVLHHRGSHQTQDTQDLSGHAPVFRDRAGELTPGVKQKKRV